MAFGNTKVELVNDTFFVSVPADPREYDGEVQRDNDTDLPIYAVEIAAYEDTYSGSKQIAGQTVQIPLEDKQHEALLKTPPMTACKLKDVTVRASGGGNFAARLNFRASGIDVGRAGATTPAPAQRQG